MKALFLLAIALAFASGARADLYKCVGKDGKVSYQAEECDQGAGSQRVRTPVGGYSGQASGGSAYKDGWDEAKSAPMVSSCVRGAYMDGKRAYMAGGGDPSKLREADLAQRLETHCDCMMRRLMTTITYADYSANPTAPLQKISAEAAHGGECKLDLSGLGR